MLAVRGDKKNKKIKTSWEEQPEERKRRTRDMDKGKSEKGKDTTNMGM